VYLRSSEESRFAAALCTAPSCGGNIDELTRLEAEVASAQQALDAASQKREVTESYIWLLTTKTGRPPSPLEDEELREAIAAEERAREHLQATKAERDRRRAEIQKLAKARFAVVDRDLEAYRGMVEADRHVEDAVKEVFPDASTTARGAAVDLQTASIDDDVAGAVLRRCERLVALASQHGLQIELEFSVVAADLTGDQRQFRRQMAKLVSQLQAMAPATPVVGRVLFLRADASGGRSRLAAILSPTNPIRN
jgi:hypothetical protein